MRISYDSEIDALYIRLIEGKHECRTVRLNEEIALNIGKDEKLVGIEILDAKEVLGAGKLPSAREAFRDQYPKFCTQFLEEHQTEQKADQPRIH